MAKKKKREENHAIYLFFPLHFDFPLIQTDINESEIEFQKKRADKLQKENESIIEFYNNLKSAKIRDLTISYAKKPYEVLNNEKKLDDNVWKEADNFLSTDLYEHFKNRFMPNNQLNEAFRGFKVLRFSDSMGRLIRNFLGNRKIKGLEIKLNQQCINRLDNLYNEEWLPFIIEDAQLHIFGSKIGILLLKITCQTDLFKSKNNEELLDLYSELLTSLRKTNARFKSKTENKYFANSIRWREDAKKTDENQDNEISTENSSDYKSAEKTDSVQDNDSEKNTSFFLEEFVENLLNLDKFDFCKLDIVRIFSLIAIDFENPISKEYSDEYIFRLSRQYTKEYNINLEEAKKYIYTPFANIKYAISKEGCAVFIEKNGDQTPSFIDGFIENAIEKAYLPLLIYAHQEYIYLERLNSNFDFMSLDLHNPSVVTKRYLENFVNEILFYRLNFRFSHVSRITMHEEFYSIYRKAFSLEEMLNELDKDTLEANNYINDYLKDKELKLQSDYQEKDRKWKEKIEKRNRIVAAIFSILVGVTGVLGMNLKEIADGCKISMFDFKFYGSVIALIFVTIIVLLITNSKDKKEK